MNLEIDFEEPPPPDDFSARRLDSDELVALADELEKTLRRLAPEAAASALIPTHKGGVADRIGTLVFEGYKGPDFDALVRNFGEPPHLWRFEFDGEDPETGCVYLHRLETPSAWLARVRAAAAHLAEAAPDAPFGAFLWINLMTSLSESAGLLLAVSGRGDPRETLPVCYASWARRLRSIPPLPGCSWTTNMRGDGWPGYPPSNCVGGFGPVKSPRLVPHEIDPKFWHATAHFSQSPARAGLPFHPESLVALFAQDAAEAGLRVVASVPTTAGFSGDSQIQLQRSLLPALAAALEEAEILSAMEPVAPALAGSL